MTIELFEHNTAMQLHCVKEQRKKNLPKLMHRPNNEKKKTEKRKKMEKWKKMEKIKQIEMSEQKNENELLFAVCECVCDDIWE